MVQAQLGEEKFFSAYTSRSQSLIEGVWAETWGRSAGKDCGEMLPTGLLSDSQLFFLYSLRPPTWWWWAPQLIVANCISHQSRQFLTRMVWANLIETILQRRLPLPSDKKQSSIHANNTSEGSLRWNLIWEVCRQINTIIFLPLDLTSSAWKQCGWYLPPIFNS